MTKSAVKPPGEIIDDELADAVANLVGLASHTDAPLEPQRVRDYLGEMVALIRSDPETLACLEGTNLLRSVVYHAFRFESHYEHLDDYCRGRIARPITIEAANEYLRAWEENHKPAVRDASPPEADRS